MKKILLIVVLATMMMSLGLQDVMASHFRFGHMSWKPRPDISATAVEFTLTNAWRRSSYPGSGGDGLVIVGDTFTETVGGTRLIYGDGVITPTLQYIVTAFDVGENWVIAQALDPNTGNNTIIHSYPSPNSNGQPWVAEINSCCRISGLSNSTSGYRVLTLVETASGCSSPISTLVPIINCPLDAVCSFPIPAADADGGNLSFRLSTPAESDINAQPAANFPLSVDANTGQVTWDTHGTSNGDLWAVQVTIEDRDPATGALKTTVAIDWIIKITNAPAQCQAPPVCSIDGGSPNANFNVAPGNPLSFTVTGTTADPANCGNISINTGGLPGTSTMTPGLPAAGASPVSSTFDWTPTVADVGPHVILFTVTDGVGQQTQCVANITVGGGQCCSGQPDLMLLGSTTVSYNPPLWEVRVEMKNNGPCEAKNINATMIPDAPWLTIPDANCFYGNVAVGASSDGAPDSYTFDLTNHPGGSFNVFFDVTYENECGDQFSVRLDPEFIPGGPTGVPTPKDAYRLDQNFPNPFNPVTSISYETPQQGFVSLRVFDVSGKLVRTLVNGFQSAGSHTQEWNGKDAAGKAVSSGVYFYRMEAGEFLQTRRMVLLK